MVETIAAIKGRENRMYMKYMRLKLWIEDCHCRYCGVEMILPTDPAVEKGKPVPSHVATIDHKYSRYNPLRGVEPQEFILCCNLCNNYRAQVEESRIPLETLRERSKRGFREDEPQIYLPPPSTNE